MIAMHSSAYPTLRQLLPGVSLAAELASAEVKGVALDSRQVEPGFLFLAIPGTSRDGRQYIGQALERGAVAIAADAEGLQLARNKVIPVEGLAHKASAIAGRFYREPSTGLTTIGITGTNGKTTCCQLLGQLFSLLERPAGVIGTLGSGVYRDGRVLLQDHRMTTPDAVLTQRLLAGFMEQAATLAAMEVSSHSLEQGRVAGVSFDTAIFTNLSHDHLDYHGSLENYAQAKLKLFRYPGLKIAILNRDDPLGATIEKALESQVACYRYSAQHHAEIMVRDIRVHPRGVRARLISPWGEGDLETGLLGRFNLSNILAVIAAACAQGLDFSRVLQATAQLHPITGRMERINSDSTDDPTVVVDYAHTPDALEKTLAALREHSGGGTLWCVFGCGGDRDKGKRQVMGDIAAALADRVVITSDNPRSESPEAIVRQIKTGAPDADVLVNRAEAIQFAVTQAAPCDTVLIAGKGHEDYQEIAGVRQPFIDREQVSDALRNRGKGHG